MSKHNTFTEYFGEAAAPEDSSQALSQGDLDQMTAEAHAYMSSRGRKYWPGKKADELLLRGAKRCSACKEVKNIGDFRNDRHKRDGLESRCSFCNSLRGEEYYSENTDHVKALDLEWRKKNREEIARRQREYTRKLRSTDPAWVEAEKGRGRDNYRAYRESDPWYNSIRNSRARARQKGLPVGLYTSKEMISYWEEIGIDPGKCFYTGIPLDESNRSVDHRISFSDPRSPGDVLENVVPCDILKNISKSDKTDDEYLEQLKRGE